MATILNREATIRTAVVEIKALTVSGKQVTLAVFRQLEEERLVEAGTGKLLGLPWGRVNYHAGCDDQGEHLHVVWQKGSELRRALVQRRDWETEHGARSGERDGQMHLLAAFLQVSRTVEPQILGKPARNGGASYGKLNGAEVGEIKMLVEGDVARGLTVYWMIWQGEWGGSRGGKYVSFETLTAAEREEAAKVHFAAFAGRIEQGGGLHAEWDSRSWRENVARYLACGAEVKQMRSEWERAYRELMGLHQLFIAV